MLRRLVQIDEDSVAVGGSGGERDLVMYVLPGGKLEDDGARKVTYAGGGRSVSC